MSVVLLCFSDGVSVFWGFFLFVFYVFMIVSVVFVGCHDGVSSVFVPCQWCYCFLITVSVVFLSFHNGISSVLVMCQCFYCFHNSGSGVSVLSWWCQWIFVTCQWILLDFSAIIVSSWLCQWCYCVVMMVSVFFWGGFVCFLCLHDRVSGVCGLPWWCQ